MILPEVKHGREEMESQGGAGGLAPRPPSETDQVIRRAVAGAVDVEAAVGDGQGAAGLAPVVVEHVENTANYSISRRDRSTDSSRASLYFLENAGARPG